MLLLNVFTLDKNNERLTRELSSPTGDLITLTKLQGAFGVLPAGIRIGHQLSVLGPGLGYQHIVPDRGKVVTASIFV